MDNCIYFKYIPEKNNFAKKVKFIDKLSFIFIDDKCNLQINHLNNTLTNNFKENNFINDFDILLEKNYEALIFECSHDNPIRLFDTNLNLKKSFFIGDITKEKIYDPIFVKVEPYSLNVFTGGNFFSKIDLITNKIIYPKQNKNYNLLNCFDYYLENSFYLLGSYNKNLLFCDFKTDQIENKIKLNFPINQIQLINKNQFLIGYRNNSQISLFDIRNLNKEIINFERIYFTQQKINFSIDLNNNILYSGDMNGKITLYNLSNYKKNNELNFMDNISSIDILDDYLLFSTGKRNFEIELNNNEEKFNEFLNKKNYSIQIIKL
jgi:WD40 repeat protein